MRSRSLKIKSAVAGNGGQHADDEDENRALHGEVR
jgi:hypothetical protein